MIEIIEEVVKELNIDPKIVRKVMDSYFFYIRTKISKIKYRELTTFKGVKTNILIPGFGKLVVKSKVDKRLNLKRNERKEESTN